MLRITKIVQSHVATMHKCTNAKVWIKNYKDKQTTIYSPCILFIKANVTTHTANDLFSYI